MVKIAVIGAGINGVTCAVKIKEKYKHFDVVLLSKDFTPNTTGDGSGGLWYPYLCGSTPIELLTKWGGETYNFIHKLWLEGGYDISAMPMYALYRRDPNKPRPDWAKVVFGYQDLDKKHLDYLKELYSVEYAYLEAAGQVMTSHVTSLRDRKLARFDVVVNCSGLGAREIVPDGNVFPIRGQILRVKAPWINATIIDEDSCHYIIPNSDTCVLGGTHQDDDFSTRINAKDTYHIINGCSNLIPGLNKAQIVSSWVGLRPGRDSVRLEAEDGSGPLFIHNYGHGGSGLTLFWGCGNEVLSLLEKYLHKNSQITMSKL